MYSFLADECIPRDLVDYLRSQGYVVEWIPEIGMSGASDDSIFEYALDKNLILLTFDRGFGDIFRFDIKNSPGVIIELINQMNKDDLGLVLQAFLSRKPDLFGKLVIIGKKKIRVIVR